MKPIRLFAAAAALVFAALAPAHGQPGAKPLYAWVQAAAGGTWQVRMVMPPASACPSPTHVRAEPDTAFNIRVCQWTFPNGVSRRAIAGDTFAVPGTVARVTVIGDTGCRAGSASAPIQNCADPLSWPFARVADAAARAGGQLIIHVGDYIYRERCSGLTPCGDNWPTWEADFLAPARNLLPAAPWVFARGNHEDCTRGGKGWYRMFDPAPFPASGCQFASDPVAVDVAGLGRILLLDTACAPWYSSGCWSTPTPSGTVNDSTRAIPFYAAQLRMMGPMAAQPSWLVTHVPLWARDATSPENPNPDSSGSYILQSAVRRAFGSLGLPAPVTLSLAGHIHIWEMIGFAAGRAPVLVAGNGGTSRNDPIPAPAILDSVRVASFTETRSFGYTVLEKVGGDWRATLHAIDASCTIGAGQAACVTLQDEDEAEEGNEEARRAGGSER